MGDEVDPFGRRKDENPLASLGWHGGERAGAAEPAPDDDPTHRVSPREPERSPPAPRADRRPAARLVRVVVVLAILLAAVGAVIGALVDEGVERADRFAREFAPPDIEAPAVPGPAGTRAGGDGAPPQRPPRGLSAGSLLRPAAFGRAITRLRTSGYGRLGNLRVAPERIDATFVTKDGRLRQVQIVPGGAVRVIGTTGAGFAGARTMTMSEIVASAPSRLARAAAGRLRQPVSRVNYLVLSDFAGTRQWNVYFKGGQIFSADGRGRITRRIS